MPSTSIVLLLVSLPLQVAVAEVKASYRYALSNFSGPVRSQWAKLAIDEERNEVYALHQRKNDIRIFDEHGMEIFVFGEGFGSATDIAIGKDGDIFVLSSGYKTAALHLLDYRGEHVAEIPLTRVPAEFAKIVPDRVEYRRGALYLVDSGALQVIVVDEAGRFQRGYDLNKPLEPYLDEFERTQKQLASYDWRKRRLEDIDMNGFTVDNDGNMFFTVPVLFSAYKLTPGGELTQFGRSGSGRGKFGVAAGIAVDQMGYVYVADRLRCVVMVFDPDLNYELEFGYRGDRPSNLIVPDDLAVDSSGNVYVGQAANRGVSVFKVVHQNVRQSQGNEETSTGFEEPRRKVKEVGSDRAEFTVDVGGGASETASEKPGWSLEENE